MELITELKCESCSSRDFTRNGDYLICDYCGSRYYSPKPKTESAKPKQQTQAPAKSTYVPPTTTKKKKGGKLRIIITILVLIFVIIPACAVILEEEDVIGGNDRVYIDVAAGEVASTADFDATVGNAVGVYQGTGSYYNPLYVKIPITIKANQDCTIPRSNFDMDDKSYPDDAIPENLELKSGETWTGFIYDDWFYSSDQRDGERGLDESHYYNRVNYRDYDKKISINWDIDVPSGDSVAVDSSSVMNVMPNTIIRMNVTFKQAFTDTKGPEAVFAAKGTDYDLPVVAELNTQLKSQLASVNPGDQVTIRGTVCSLQARVENTAVINEVVLRDAAIVTG